MYVVKHLEESLTSVTEGLSVRGLLVELVMKEVKATKTITMAIITTSLRINRMNSLLPEIKIPRNVCYRSEDYLWNIKSSLFLATQLTVNPAVQSGFLIEHYNPPRKQPPNGNHNAAANRRPRPACRMYSQMEISPVTSSYPMFQRPISSMTSSKHSPI